MENLRERFQGQGFVRLNGFFSRQDIEHVRTDARWVFLNQMASHGFVGQADVDEREFERAMARYFSEDPEGFINCGKTCQHLISLHRLSLRDEIMKQLIALGVKRPNICTRPVLYFNSRHLAKSQVYYKSPPHQDWRSMQGSLKAMVIWVPLADVPRELGALEIIPGSHIWGLQDSREDEWYRRIEGLRDEQYQSVEMNAGDVLFFSAFLVHRSGSNVTDSIRGRVTFGITTWKNPPSYLGNIRILTFTNRNRSWLHKDFPSIEELQKVFPGRAAATSS